MRELLIYLALIYQGDYKKIKKAIEKGEIYERTEIETKLRGIQSQYVTILDEDYPKLLRQIEDPPFVLFYYGNLGLVDLPTISMIGMREPSVYGRKMASYFASQLADDFVIVSGMAKGIDGICHRYAKKTIAVLGCGIDYCYPKCHEMLYRQIKNTGLVISEYPSQTKPQRHYFPWRNRIVSGLGLGLIVVEAKTKSGTMITVGHALSQGKPIFAVPCRLEDAHGTLNLIKDGAIVLIDVLDIYEELNFVGFSTKSLTTT